MSNQVKSSPTKQGKIKKVLIANRGEIAIRIMQTAKKLGIKTVAVCSESDRGAYFTQLADEVVNIGGVLPRESYLDVDKIVAAIKQTGADAVHPGYGFLAEKEDFAKTIEDMGLIFVGPSSKSIGMMGDKVSAKKIAAEAEVSIVPGFVGAIGSSVELHKVVSEIGLPVMIKASAGGGGKGMRIVYNKEDLDIAFENCRSEAIKNFKDERVFVEKYIQNPRHIEVQILGDKSGNVVCLGERECSIQRFNQKIVEEAPSTFVNAKMRQKMYAQSVMLAKKYGYFSAGTVEYVVDQDKNFYFLEMNTRLQVEHAVTEMVIGIDIVEQMFRIAEGEKLEFAQKDIKLKGWSIECRICAEDTANGFAPSSGRISRYIGPKEHHNVRFETSYLHGGHVSPFFDAMIAKVVTYGDTRNEAILAMRKALGNYIIEGVKTNLSMLEAIMMNDDFESGNLSTDFVKKHYPNGFGGLAVSSGTSVAFIFAAVVANCYQEERFSMMGFDIDSVPSEFVAEDVNRFCVLLNGQKFNVQLKDCDVLGEFSISIDGSKPINFGGERMSDGNVIINFVGNDYIGPINAELVKVRHNVGGKYNMAFRATEQKVYVCPLHVSDLLKFMPPEKEKVFTGNEVVSSMTGLVVSVRVQVGQEVKKGQCVVTVEAMKMENFIPCERDGIVKCILRSAGDIVTAGDVIVELE